MHSRLYSPSSPVMALRRSGFICIAACILAACTGPMSGGSLVTGASDNEQDATADITKEFDGFEGGNNGDTYEADVIIGDSIADDAGPREPDAQAPEDTAPAVRFLEPANGAHIPNPVTFVFETEAVATVQIEADQWPLAPSPWNPTQQNSLTYTFSGTGFEREIVLFGYDSSGREIARDTLRMTVEEVRPLDKGTAMGTFRNTYYYLAEETAHTGDPTQNLYDRNCNVIARVSSSFANAACIEGSARLADGRVINYAQRCSCGGPCSFCWAVMDPSRFPWGMGSRGNALVPLLSWAVDTSIIPHGTVVYVEEWDGLELPDVDGLGARRHDGCFRADDVGGGINGYHVDIFAGSRAMWQALERIFPTRTNFVVYKDSPRCSHL